MYESNNLVRGIRLIDNLQNNDDKLSETTLLRAKFIFFEKSDCKIILHLLWLENNYNTKGIVVTDSKNISYTSEIFSWDKEYRDYFAETIGRWREIIVAINERNDLSNPETKIRFPKINLPSDVFGGKIKVGLIMKNGTHTNMVDTYVSPAVIEIVR